MKAPFEKFVIISADENHFTVVCSSPTLLSDGLKSGIGQTLEEVDRRRAERWQFIETAVQEKLEGCR